jgi:hypothetical protein
LSSVLKNKQLQKSDLPTAEKENPSNNFEKNQTNLLDFSLVTNRLTSSAKPETLLTLARRRSTISRVTRQESVQTRQQDRPRFISGAKPAAEKKKNRQKVGRRVLSQLLRPRKLTHLRTTNAEDGPKKEKN